MPVVNINDFSQLIVIGFYCNSTRRFRRVFEPENWRIAMSINLWRGKVYGIHKLTKKRILLKEAHN